MSELDPSTRLDADESRADASRSLARSAGVIGATTLTSRILGLVREQVMAYFFGASNAVDAFNVAFRIPNLVRDLFAEGAMSAAFVPTFTRTVARDGRDAAWRLGHSVVTAVLIATAIVAVLGIVFADPLVRLLAGDYALVPGKIELTVLLTRTMMPFLILVATAAVAMGMLNSLDRFFVPALAPAVFNVCSIADDARVVAGPRTARHSDDSRDGRRRAGWRRGPGRDPVAGAEARGLSLSADARPQGPGLRDVLLLMGPGTLGLAATQVNVFVNTWLATGEGTGAVSWLNYAFRLMYLPLGLFGVSIATASIPRIARRAAAEDRDGLRRTISTWRLDDAGVDGAGNARTRRARASDRRAAVRARPLHAGRHRGHRGRVDVLRDRTLWLFDRQGGHADVLRDRKEPGAGHRLGGDDLPSTSRST